VKGESLDR
jgi:hypothetical protein